MLSVEDQRAKWREQHRKNRARRLVRMRAYYEKNRTQVREQVRQHRKLNAERLQSIDRSRWTGERRKTSNMSRAVRMLEQRTKEPWKFLLKSAIERARRKNVPFLLTEEWAQNRWTGRCELTGLEFQLGLRKSGPKFYSPSIDRVVPSLGYIPENCRFVLWAVNAMKYDATDSDIYALADALLLNKNRGLTT